jgi:hypothetical protein
MKHHLTLTLTLSFLATYAQAGEVYTAVGTHGFMLGYAQAFSPGFSLRTDFAGIGKRTIETYKDNISYEGPLKAQRVGLFADWYPFQGNFRFTGGVTFNRIKSDLLNVPSGSNQLTLGNQTYTTAPGDRLKVQAAFPSTTPYVGFGWGHQLGKGLGFVFDIGASIGKAKLSATASGPNFDRITGAQRQQLERNVALQTQTLRTDVEKVKALPLVAMGFNYRF